MSRSDPEAAVARGAPLRRRAVLGAMAGPLLVAAGYATAAPAAELAPAPVTAAVPTAGGAVATGPGRRTVGEDATAARLTEAYRVLQRVADGLAAHGLADGDVVPASRGSTVIAALPIRGTRSQLLVLLHPTPRVTGEDDGVFSSCAGGGCDPRRLFEVDGATENGSFTSTVGTVPAYGRWGPGADLLALRRTYVNGTTELVAVRAAAAGIDDRVLEEVATTIGNPAAVDQQAGGTWHG